MGGIKVDVGCVKNRRLGGAMNSRTSSVRSSSITKDGCLLKLMLELLGSTGSGSALIDRNDKTAASLVGSGTIDDM